MFMCRGLDYERVRTRCTVRQSALYHVPAPTASGVYNYGKLRLREYLLLKSLPNICKNGQRISVGNVGGMIV